MSKIFFQVFLRYFCVKNGDQNHNFLFQDVVGYASILLHTLKPKDEAKIRDEIVQVNVYFI